MKVLLITPDKGKESVKTYFPAPSLGVERLASYLRRNNFDVETVDPNLDSLPIDKNYDVVGVGTYHLTLKNDIANLYRFKKQRLGPLLVAGGIESTFDPKTIMEKSPVDIVVLGEGEYALSEIVRKHSEDNDLVSKYKHIPGLVIRSNDGFVFTGEKNAFSANEFTDVTMSLDFAKINYRKYWETTRNFYKEANDQEINSIRIFTANKCPFRCSFCSSRNFLDSISGKSSRIAMLSIDNTIKLLQKCSKSYPDALTVIFDDDNCLINKKRMIQLSNKIIEEKERKTITKELTFICQGRTSTIAEVYSIDDLKHLKKAGFRMLNIGVESFCQEILDDLKKDIKEDQIWRALEKLKESEIQAHVYIIMIPPTTKKKHIVKNIESISRCLRMGMEVGINKDIIPLPGSDIINDNGLKIVREKVLIPGTDQFLMQSNKILPNDPEVSKIAERLDEELEDYKEQIINDFGIIHIPPRINTLIVSFALCSIIGESGMKEEIKQLIKKEMKK